jgi:uracil-DNA glycosylase
MSTNELHERLYAAYEHLRPELELFQPAAVVSIGSVARDAVTVIPEDGSGWPSSCKEPATRRRMPSATGCAPSTADNVSKASRQCGANRTKILHPSARLGMPHL